MGEFSKLNLNDIVYYVRDRDYAVCDTAQNVAKKVVNIEGLEVVAGAKVSIKFTYANTAANPTLNVNGTGAKSIKRYGTTPVGSTAQTSWYAGEIVTLVYDGTNWVCTNSAVVVNTATASGFTITESDGIMTVTWS